MNLTNQIQCAVELSNLRQSLARVSVAARQLRVCGLPHIANQALSVQQSLSELILNVEQISERDRHAQNLTNFPEPL